MSITNGIKEYLPIITALLGAFLAYFFNNRKSKSEQFRKDAVEGLEEFYSPLFHEMRTIKIRNNLEDNKNVEELNRLVDKLVNKDTKIYKSYNQNLINLVYELDEKLKTYYIRKEDIILNDALKLFNQLYDVVKKENLEIQRSLYKQYPWYKFLNNRNYILRFLMDLSTLFYETVQFLGLLYLFAVYVLVFDTITGVEVPRNTFIINFGPMAGLIIGLYAIALTVRIPYFIVTTDYRKRNKILEKINKRVWTNIKNITLNVVTGLVEIVKNSIIYLKRLLK